MAAKTIKMCDMPGDIAAKVFQMLNGDLVELKEPNMYRSNTILVTDTEPSDLVYPEGWYYAKGHFRNKHMSTTKTYSEIIMMKTNGDLWSDSAKYCTAD